MDTGSCGQAADEPQSRMGGCWSFNRNLALGRGAAFGMAEGDARLAEIVGGHLDIHAVADADPDEMLAHLARDVGEDFVAVGQGHAKHGAGQHLGYRAGQFNGFFFCHKNAVRKLALFASNAM